MTVEVAALVVVTVSAGFVVVVAGAFPLVTALLVETDAELVPAAMVELVWAPQRKFGSL